MSRQFDDKHIPLAVAAALACNRLSAPQRPQFYDAQHLSDVMTLVAQALVRATRVYIPDENGAARPLSQAELEGSEVRRGATLLLLADGRQLSDATIRRGDLVEAIDALKAGAFDAALQELNSRSNSFRTTS